MNMADMREVEAQVCAFADSNGFLVPEGGFVFDGKLHRYATDGDRGGERSGSYRLYSDGRPAGWIQDFRQGKPQKWRFSSVNVSHSQRLDTRSSFGGAEPLRQKKDSVSDASKLASALAAYNAARSVEEADQHPYLLAKRVTPRGGFSFGGVWYGLRVGDMVSSSGKLIKGQLLIPMADLRTWEPCALHRVFPWRDSGSGRFPKGWTTPAGGVFPIGVDVPRGPAFVAEGIATALSWYQHWADEADMNEPCAVLAAMDCGNLKRQAAAIRAAYIGRKLYLLQDDDEAGRQTAEACLAAGFDGAIDAGWWS